MTHVRADGARNLPRAAAAEARRHRDVLPSGDAERDRITLDGRAEPRLPERFTGLHVERAERPIEIAHEPDAARRRQHRREERRALLAAPDFLHRLHVVRRELADVALAAGHLEETAVRAGAARSVGELDLAARHLHARLAERDDEQPRARVIAHRLPVVPALGAGTRLHPLAGLLLEDVAPVLRRAGLRVDRLEDVLEHRFLVAEEPAILPIDLPQDARLADREHDLLVADVDEHAFEHFVEIERFARRVLVVPRERPVLRPDRDRGARIEHVVEVGRAPARAHPRLGLRDAPIHQVEIRIVAAGDPRLAADAQVVGELAPRLAARLAVSPDGVELPELLAGRRVVAADPAAVVAVPIAADPTGDDDAVHDHRAGGVRIALGAVGDRGVPYLLAGARVERGQTR